jgi:hypothetical protein
MTLDNAQNSNHKTFSPAPELPDIHLLDLPKDIIDPLLANGVISIRQIELMNEDELARINGIDWLTAIKIKQAFYRHWWETKTQKKIATMEEVKSLIDTLTKKDAILRYGTGELQLLAYPAIKAFYGWGIKTIGDILLLGSEKIFRIKGIGAKKYKQIIEAILEVAAFFERSATVSAANTQTESLNFAEEGIAESADSLQTDRCDLAWGFQPDMTFREILTESLGRFGLFGPRNREILFEYYFIHRAEYGCYVKIAVKYNLSRERIRQICMKGMRILRQKDQRAYIMDYLRSVWKEKIYQFVRANGGRTTKPQLEREFAAELAEIYFLQNEVLRITDIWAINLEKDDNGYYLPPAL